MDFFEKQHRFEAVQKIVKVRWFTTAIVVTLGLVLKTEFFGGWAQEFEYTKIATLMIVAFGYNFVYWIFIRRPIEKISDRALTIITFCQVVVDQIMYALVFYFTGTVETMAFLLFYITILIASSLYKTKGIVFSGLLAVFLHNGILITEYYHLIPHLTSYQGTVWFGNLYMTRGKIIGFTFYMAVAVIYSGVLSAFIRRREVNLRQQRDQLTNQSQVLTQQTQELTKTKDLLQDALTKSDRARVDLFKAKDELEKANLELREKIGELEKFSNVAIGRELKMVELKKEIKNLQETIKKLESQVYKKK